MGRKNMIEGQMNLFEYMEAQVTQVREAPEAKPGGFAECADCWCATCEHSTVGGGKPRAFADRECVCPSCEMCVSEGKADVCVIGSADEGCRFRAEKEGLV